MSENCFVQYHNVDEREFWPVFKINPKSKHPDWSSFYTTKNYNLKGEKVFLIAGVKKPFKKKKDYYLFGYIEVAQIDNDGGDFILSGPSYACKNPLHLNLLNGFDNFIKKTVNNFSLGLQNVCKDPFSRFIIDEKNFYPVSEMNGEQEAWVECFEEMESEEDERSKKGVAPEYVCKHVWDYLVNLAINHTTSSYDDLRNYVNARTGRNYLCRGTATMLRPIQNYCIECNLPALTVLIMGKVSGKPGNGYDKRGKSVDKMFGEVYAYSWNTLQNPFSGFESEDDTVKSFAKRILKAPENAEDIYSRIKVRGTAQRVFRAELLECYENKCAICGLNVPEILQAAHIKPWNECTLAERYAPTNGILLCPNHHALWDKGMIVIRPNYTIACPSKVEKGTNGEKLTLPKNQEYWPSKELLEKRNEQ